MGLWSSFPSSCLEKKIMEGSYKRDNALHNIFPHSHHTFVTLPEDRQGLVSYSFLLSSSSFFFFFFFFFLLLLSSGNTSFSHTSLHLILTKLAHSDRYLDHYSGTDNGGVRGHDGVTGVKKVIFTKKASSPTEYLALMRDLCI